MGPKRTAKILIFSGNSNNWLKISRYLSERPLSPGLRLPFPLVYGCHSTEACGHLSSNRLKLSQLQNALPQPLQKFSTPAAHPSATPYKPITSTHSPRRPFTHGRHCRARMDSSTGPECFPPWEPQQLPYPPSTSTAQVGSVLGAGTGSSWCRYATFLAQVQGVSGAGMLPS